MSVFGVTVPVTEDGVQRALAGAGVTRDSRRTCAASALLRVSGGLRAVAVAGRRERDTGMLCDVIVVV